MGEKIPNVETNSWGLRRSEYRARGQKVAFITPADIFKHGFSDDSIVPKT